MAKRKVLIIGLDGGDWRLLKWISNYTQLPTLQRLKEEGAWGVLESTIPANTPAAWTSFQTGMSPGQTNIFDFSFWDLKKRKKKIINANYLPTTLWQRLSQANKRVGVINLPLTYPPKEINGQLIGGILTPSLKSDFTWPPRLKRELLKEVPDYQIFNLATIKQGDPHQNLRRFIKEMRKMIENRWLATDYLLNRYRYDLLMVHLQATDPLQHVLWGYLDPSHRLFDQEKARYIAQEFYYPLDQLINKLIDSFRANQEAEPLVLILSDHGFEAHQKRFELGSWLQRKGYLKINPFFYNQSLRRLARKIAKPSYFIWSRSKAFSAGRSGEGFIYLLDKEIKKRLTKELKKIKDPETKEPIVKKIWPQEQLLILEPQSGYSFSGVPERRKRKLFHRVNPKDDFQLGKHRRQGILIAQGPGVKKTRLKAQIIDLAPTILYYLKAPPSDEIEGEVIKDIL